MDYQKSQQSYNSQSSLTPLHQTIKPREKADTLNNLLKKIFEKKSEFNKKVLLVKDEKTNVLAKLDKLSQNLVDIQYLLEPADRKTVPTIPM